MSKRIFETASQQLSTAAHIQVTVLWRKLCDYYMHLREKMTVYSPINIIFKGK